VRQVLSPVGLTVDLVVVAQGHVLLVRRGRPPFLGRLALPGGFVERGERLAAAARRECQEETGLLPRRLVPAGAYGEPGRDPRGRVVSFVFRCELSGAVPAVRGGDDARDALWVPIARALRLRLAFDHDRILREVIGAGRRPGAAAPPSRRGRASRARR